MKRNHICAALMTLGGALIPAYLGDFSRAAGYQLIWVVLIALAWIGNLRFGSVQDRRARWCFGVLGVLFVFALGLGFRLEAVDETGWDGLALCVLLGLVWGPAAGWFFFRFAGWLEGLRPSERNGRYTFLLAWGVLLICWLPVIIAYFPGITGYDMDSQIYHITSGNYSAHHPILHTLFIEMFIRLFGFTLGYGLHTVAQAVLLAASIAYALAWLLRIRCPKGLWGVLLAYFALSPQHAIMAVSGTKDILFAAAMLVVAVEWLRLFIEEGRIKRPVVLVFDVVMMAVAGMLRNNAIYGMAAVFAVSLLFCRRLGVGVLAVLLSGMIAAYGGTGLVNQMVNAYGTSLREKMSVPCQQLGRVYYKYGTSIPVGYEIPELLPDAENYKPDRADYTKRSAKVTPNDRLVRFLKLWGREALNHPIEYIDAFLLNTKGFWYLGDHTFATTYDEIEGSRIGCMVLKHVDTLGIDAPWMLPGLRAVYQELFAHNAYRAFTPGWMLLHPALYTWLLGFLLAWAVWRRQSGALMSLGMLLGYLLTLFLGPCAIIRYQYNLMLAAPVVTGFLCVQAGRAEVEA